MYPILFSFWRLSISLYGIMLGIAFYLGFLIGEREFKLRGKDPELAYILFLVSIPSAIIGAKLFHIMDHFGEFMRDWTGILFSGSGLSVYGGLVMALVACYFVIKFKGEKPLEIFDITTPTLALGYGLGRIGCHLAGDSCYGIETSSFLGVAFPNGLSPIDATVYPTPLFESMFSFLVFFMVMQLRKRELPTGMLFFIYLLCNAIPRFLIEFIRLNPKIILGLTQAQFVAIGLGIIAIVGLVKIKKNAAESTI